MDKALWEKAVKFHGHECPGLAIGVKACEAVMEKMGICSSSDEDLVCITENNACGVDAIQSIIGCSIGKGNLIYRGTGKQAFNFYNRTNGQSLRIYLKVKNNGMERSSWQQKLLNSSVDELFDFSSPTIELPEKARLFVSITCESCGENASENKIRLQEGKKVCLDCFNDHSRGW